MSIQAIETRYKGFRFRSRAEARFAVFMDALGEPWEYEAQGYKLSSGRYYLPDFFVPDWKAFVEIKGAEPSDDELNMCVELSGAAELSRGPYVPRNKVIIISGSLWPGQSRMWLLQCSQPRVTEANSFGTCRKCPCIYLGNDNTGWARLGSKCCDSDKWPLGASENTPALMAAYKAARSARFEHGENGPG